MGKVVLVVEKDDRVRVGIRNALQACKLPIFEVPDAFDAMSALGRAEWTEAMHATAQAQRDAGLDWSTRVHMRLRLAEAPL